MIEAALASFPSAAEKGGFIDYLVSLISSRDMVQLFVLWGAGIAGMAGNYTFKWLKGDARGTKWCYLYSGHPRRLALAVATLLGYSLTTIATGLLEGVGWSATLNLGLTTGFAIDALINKTKRAVWSQEERAARTAS